jgi:Flp pilus assembly protein TadG
MNRWRCGRSIRAFLGADEGATIVEFALAAPPFLLLLLGIMEFGQLLWTQSSLDFAVQEASRCASVDKITCGSASSVQAYAVSRAAGLGFSPSVFTLVSASCGNQVTASYTYHFVVGQTFPYTPTLRASSCFPS